MLCLLAVPPAHRTHVPWHPLARARRSILHPPGDDTYGYESASERWLPIHTVESILISVISMIASPNDESPANLDAAVMWRDNRPEYEKKVKKCVRDSQE